MIPNVFPYVAGILFAAAVLRLAYHLVLLSEAFNYIVILIYVMFGVLFAIHAVYTNPNEDK
jgi:hypothetical protein